MNELQIFNYEGKPIRTVERADGIWWVLKDVCDVLGIKNSRDVVGRLDNDEKGVAIIDTPGGNQEMNIVSEPGLYNVIFRSGKPEAKDFKRWVTHEVLPTLRRTGSYAMAPAAAPMSPAQLLAAQAQLLVEMERRVDEVQGQTQALEARVDTALKAFSRPAEDHWKSDMDAAIKDLCRDQGWSVTATKGRMYAELDRTAACSVNARLNRLRDRNRKAGMRRRDAMELTKLDAIAADKQLRAIFEGVVRSWQAKAVSPTGNSE